jgi:endonuclease/exonuclease/phosphatase family metal-dependent hydrolase
VGSLRVLTWNILWQGNAERIDRKLQALADTPWDVALLQEVGRQAWAAMQSADWFDDGVHGCDLAGWQDRQHPIGSAILLRNGVQLSDASAPPGQPIPGRAVAGNIEQEERAATVCSWHAPNAAGDGVDVKMDGYRAIVSWANGITDHCVLGADTNHWSLTTSLIPAAVPDSDDAWLFENQFFGAQPLHRLRDALLDALARDPDRYAALIDARPEGPLEVSYIRSGTEDRFDYILVSPDIEVSECRYDYAGGKAAGSDHGIVTADLAL